ncbi:MAG: flagellar motor protein MotB [Gemmatimonadales bacterium]|nr:MAG: flagellar motor protein MotB [Gemmatimonadales bacterium]
MTRARDTAGEGRGSTSARGGGGSRPIIVVRKRRRPHSGHHGGSWKVAYADFVTAMMAFFLVMWIMGMDQDARDLVQGYFNNPLGMSPGNPTGLNPLTSGQGMQLQGSGTPAFGALAERAQFESVAMNLRRSFQASGLADLGVELEVIVSTDGLRMEIMEAGQEEIFFGTGDAKVRPVLISVLGLVAAEIRRLSHEIVVEGHTDARPYVGEGPYGNWELSVDRANAARRAMESDGLGGSRISEVRGHADRALRVAGDGLAPQNRRVSLFVPALAGAVPLWEPAAREGEQERGRDGP